MLVEIMAQAWTQYRNGLVYAIQHADFDSAIMYLFGMVAMLPEQARPKIKPVPKIKSLKEDFMSKREKWEWVTETDFAVEQAISQWIHNNFDKMKMGG
jgi:hypothetical protein